MADYTQNTDFSAKDALATGDPNKVIYGADIDAELALVSTAIASKVDDINTLTEDTSPQVNDYAVVYDSSASAQKKILLSKLSSPSLTLAYVTGSASQTVLSSAGWTEITCVRTETLDTAGIFSTGGGTYGRIAPPSTDYNGYYLVFARLSVTIAFGNVIRLAVTRFNSSGVAQARKYIETNAASPANQLVFWGIHNLTFASGDYIALETWGNTVNIVVDNSTQNEIVAFKI
jgi:hypothetical protein